MKQAAAHLRFLRMAPRKVRAIADVIRGMSVNEAEAQLMLNPRRAAKPVLKLLRSAINSAKAAGMSDMGMLTVATITVDQGPMMKRFLPRARGSASPLQKKMSHVHLLLSESAVSKKVRFTITPKPKKATAAPVEVQIPEKPKAPKRTTPQDKNLAKVGKEKSLLGKIFHRKTEDSGS